jgi:hypothetical protein
MARHGALAIHDRRKILHLVVGLGDEAVLALLCIALSGLVVRRGQIRGQDFLQ